MYTSGENFSSFGWGISMGFELRKYFLRVLTGPFAGRYGGAGVQLYRDDGETVREAAVSIGPKMGCRIPLFNGLDLEPYTALGVFFPMFDPAMYLGMKLDI